MPAKRKNERAAEMTALYAQGFSLSKVAQAFGVSRQAAYKMLKRRGVDLRSQMQLPFIEWDGRKFSIRENGYYAETSCNREYLHRAIWRKSFGEIPDGFEVHHKDEDKLNNKPSNLELLTQSDHGKAHGFGGNQYVPSNGRRPIK